MVNPPLRIFAFQTSYLQTTVPVELPSCQQWRTAVTLLLLKDGKQSNCRNIWDRGMHALQIQIFTSCVRNVFVDNHKSHWSREVIKTFLVSRQHLCLIWSVFHLPDCWPKCDCCILSEQSPENHWTGNHAQQFKSSYDLLLNHWQDESSNTCTTQPHSEVKRETKFQVYVRDIFICFTLWILS